MKIIIAASLALLLSGCSYGKYQASGEASENTDLHFIGVPTLAGAVGSSFPIGEGYSLTAKHVAKVMIVDVIAYHPSCDVAIIRRPSSTPPRKIRVAAKGESVSLYGHAAMLGALPVKSSGLLTGFGMLDDSYNRKCQGMTTTAGVTQGMSGGAAIGSDGKIIGLIYGYNRKRGFSIIIPAQSFSKWVKKETGIEVSK